MMRKPFKNGKEYAPVLVRIAIALVVLWFGINQLVVPQNFVGYVPSWASSFGVSPQTMVMMNGAGELALGLLLLLGFFTRITALLVSLHLFVIAASLGYNDIAIRDIGLALVSFSIFLHGPDTHCKN